MNRRDFIRTASVVYAALPLLSVQACEKKQTEPVAGESGEAFSPEEATIDLLQAKMKDGSLTCRALTEMYLDRITTLDKRGPTLNSVIEVNPDALAIAESLDDERRNGKVRGPLHGIPVLIKDNIDTGDRMMTTAGSLALEGNIAARDAFIVARLRQAGALILGKTNLKKAALSVGVNSVVTLISAK